MSLLFSVKLPVFVIVVDDGVDFVVVVVGTIFSLHGVRGRK